MGIQGAKAKYQSNGYFLQKTMSLAVECPESRDSTRCGNPLVSPFSDGQTMYFQPFDDYSRLQCLPLDNHSHKRGVRVTNTAAFEPRLWLCTAGPIRHSPKTI